MNTADLNKQVGEALELLVDSGKVRAAAYGALKELVRAHGVLAQLEQHLQRDPTLMIEVGPHMLVRDEIAISLYGPNMRHSICFTSGRVLDGLEILVSRLAKLKG